MKLIPVTIHHDLLDRVVAWSTLIAALLAVVALAIGLYSIYRADRGLMHERRLTFELDILARLARACGQLWAGSTSEVFALLDLLPGELDGLRTDIENRVRNGIAFSASEQMLANHWADYEVAIRERLSRRRA